MPSDSETPKESKPGPKPETVRIEDGEVDWKDALKHAMSKPKSDDDKSKEKDQQD